MPSLRRACSGALFCLLFSLLASKAALGQEINVVCLVFEDLNEDGSRQTGEAAFPGARLSDGRTVHTTGLDGYVTVAPDTTVFPFVCLTIPSEWWTTGPWFARFERGAAAPDTIVFGLRPNPVNPDGSFRWIHIADTQMVDCTYDLAADVAVMNRVDPPPMFLMNAGDIVHRGEREDTWQCYADAMALSEVPVFNVVGNHDDDPVAVNLHNYERYAGPPYYSFEIGNWHFVGYNAFEPETYTPAQADWLLADTAAADPDHHVAVFQHFMMQGLAPSQTEELTGCGTEANFSGHWHSLHISETPAGIGEYNMSQTRWGPLDRTPRGFALVTFQADGTVTYDLRRFSTTGIARIASPAASASVSGDELDVVVQAYDTATDVASVTVTLMDDGLAEVLAVTSATASVSSHWDASIDIADLEPGDYYLRADIEFFGVGSMIAERWFHISGLPSRASRLGTDWPMFRRTPDGAGFTPDHIELPLELAWCSPLPGMVVLSSPIVAEGRVYVGYRTENESRRAGVSAFQANSGRLLWERAVNGGVALAPAYMNGVLVAQGLSGAVQGFDAGTGLHLWTAGVDTFRYITAAPIGDNGSVWCGNEPICLRLNSLNGWIEWTSPTLGSDWFPYVYSSPVLWNDQLHLGGWGSPWGLDGTGGGHRVLDADTGDLLHSGGNQTCRSPLVLDDRLYLARGDSYDQQTLQCYDASLQPLWSQAVDVRYGTGSPVGAHGIVVIPGRFGAVLGLDAETGDQLWSRSVGTSLYDMRYASTRAPGTPATAAIADSTVFIGSLDGVFRALSLHSGELLWSWNLGTPIASSAAVSGNMVFVAASDGHLYAFRSVRNESTTSANEADDSTRLSFAAPSPNPAQYGSGIAWSQPRESRARVELYDARGRRVRLLVDEVAAPGRHTVLWEGSDDNGRSVPAGVYFVQITSGGETRVRKLLVVK